MSRNIDRLARELERKAKKLAVPKTVEDRFARYRDDPVAFCTEVLGLESATRRSNGEPYQFTVLHDLARHPRVIVRSGHGVGKSTVNAVASLWWLLTRPFSRVVVVAPEFSRQVRAVLFSEMRKWSRRAKVKLPVEVLANRVLVEGHGEEWSAVGLPATEPDRIEGFHSESGVLLILDETKGIPQDVYDALQGALTGTEQNRLLVTSTPGGPEGPFYRIWTRGGSTWARHHIPSPDSSLVDPTWVEDRKREWGDASPIYQARVLGEFPDIAEGVLFPLSLLEAATERAVDSTEPQTVSLGVDVARSVAGDLCAIALCRGPKLQTVFTWRSSDTMQVVARVQREVVERNPSVIRVDVGGPGAGVVDRLRELGRAVEEVYFGGAARDAQRFANRRAELYWQVREALERGDLALPDDDELIADLSALRYEFDAKGRILLEAKDDVRKRLGRSPDRADALALAAFPAQTSLALDTWTTDVHLLEHWFTPKGWHHLGCLSFGYRGEGGMFVMFAVGPDGDLIAVEEAAFYRNAPYEIGQMVGEMCRRYPPQPFPYRLAIATSDDLWKKAGPAGITIAEEIQLGIFDSYPARDEAPVLIEAASGPGAAATRLALLRRYLAFGEGPYNRPRLRFTPRTSRTAQALASLKADPRDPEVAEEHPAFDAVTSALLSRPMLPDRPPRPVDYHRHPGLQRDGSRNPRPDDKLDEFFVGPPPDRSTGFRVPRELVPMTDKDFFDLAR